MSWSAEEREERVSGLHSMACARGMAQSGQQEGVWECVEKSDGAWLQLVLHAFQRCLWQTRGRRPR